MLIFSNKCDIIQLSGENNMILTTNQLIEKYSNYVDPKGKIARDVRDGKLFHIVRGYYETEENTSGEKLSQVIYGPSYLSFDYALAEYGLIPEAVHLFTCATFNKKKIKTYTNKFGTYLYRDIPNNVFSYGLIAKIDENYSYLIATPEKALCDKLYTVSPVKSIKKLKALLFEDLRIYENEFDKLNKNNILEIAPLYHSTNLNLLIKMIKQKKIY